jgi:protein-tyrosine-phosphatase
MATSEFPELIVKDHKLQWDGEVSPQQLRTIQRRIDSWGGELAWILTMCQWNVGRSQMMHGILLCLFQELGLRVNIQSAGFQLDSVEKHGAVPTEKIRHAMSTRPDGSIDISDEKKFSVKPITEEIIANLVPGAVFVILCTPIIWATFLEENRDILKRIQERRLKLLFTQVPDPDEQDTDQTAATRDEVEKLAHTMVIPMWAGVLGIPVDWERTQSIMTPVAE